MIYNAYYIIHKKSGVINSMCTVYICCKQEQQDPPPLQLLLSMQFLSLKWLENPHWRCNGKVCPAAAMSW